MAMVCIKNVECDGCMDCQAKEAEYRCPVCGEELEYDDKVFSLGGDVVGCVHCIETADAEDVL